MKLYFSLLLIPDKAFSEQITGFKKQLKEIHDKPFFSVNAPAHLSLCRFSIKSGEEQELVEVLGSYLEKEKPLSLQCGGLGGFPESGTLFLEIINPEPFRLFQASLTQMLKSAYPSLKRNLSIASVPHITLGRDFNAAELNK